MRLMWTPPSVDPLLGTVFSTERTLMSEAQYLGRLEARLERMVEKATRAEVRELEEKLWGEGLMAMDVSPSRAAEMLVQECEALTLALASLDKVAWPVPEKAWIKTDPEMAEVSLEDFVMHL